MGLGEKSEVSALLPIKINVSEGTHNTGNTIKNNLISYGMNNPSMSHIIYTWGPFQYHWRLRFLAMPCLYF